MRATKSTRVYAIRETAELVVVICVLAVVSQFVRVSVWVWFGVLLGKILTSTASYVLFLRRTFHRPVCVGPEALVGLIAETVTSLNPSGQVKINGEIWSALSESGATIPSQQRVRILEVHRTTVYVAIST